MRSLYEKRRFPSRAWEWKFKYHLHCEHGLYCLPEHPIGRHTWCADIHEHAPIVRDVEQLAGEHIKAGQALMARMAENQMELKPSLTRLATVAENSLGQDDVLRTHLRNIEAYLARLTEDVAQGRAQSVQELRAEIRILARTIAGLAEEGRR